jgi:hypothetical protein
MDYKYPQAFPDRGDIDMHPDTFIGITNIGGHL